MTVAVNVRATGRMKKKRAASVSTTSSDDSLGSHSSSCSTRSIIRMSPAKHTRSSTKRTAVKDLSNHKITEFFQVRRSNRKTSKQIEEEERDALKYAVLSGTNEDLLDIYKDNVKGRGIRAGCDFSKGQFVIEYRGHMMDYSEAKMLEEKYSADEEIGSYMYFFNYNNKKWCVDATKESPWKGRLINHSMMRPNLKTKVVEFDGQHHLILVAKRDIMTGEELLYDYGDRTAATIAKNPWLTNT